MRLQVTPKGKKLAGTLIGQGKKKTQGVMKINNHVRGTDKIRLTVRLK